MGTLLGGGPKVIDASRQVAILSSGVWQLRDAVREITGMEPVRWMPPLRFPDFGCVAGWGLKPTSRYARVLSKRTDTEYLALEDGFIRSVYPGPMSTPLSLVLDRSGVHYDASSVSDLEVLIEASAGNFDEARLRRAAAGIEALRSHVISKYNHSRCFTPAELGLSESRLEGRVLVVDQTVGDCSVAYGAATAKTFTKMLAAARTENPDAEIIVKLHPEVVSKRKKGYLSNLSDPDLRVVDFDVNPWSLIEAVDKVYVVTSQLGLEALMARKRVTCFGLPFYAGWGLTDDRKTISRRTARPSLEQMFAAIYFDYTRYISPVTRKQISFEDAVAWMISERARLCS
jgi:capsular polysaccharide export protein